MMLSLPFLEKSISLSDDHIAVLILENPIILRNTVQGLLENDENLILSEDNTTLSLTKYVEVIESPFSLDFSSKTISNGIQKEAQEFMEDFTLEASELMQQLNQFGFKISSKFTLPILHTPIDDSVRLIKFLNFTADTEDLSFPERLLLYMNLCRTYLKKELFVFLNLKNFLSSAELEAFYKNALYEKFFLLLLESTQSHATEWEKTIILDQDLCEIQ